MSRFVSALAVLAITALAQEPVCQDEEGRYVECVVYPGEQEENWDSQPQENWNRGGLKQPNWGRDGGAVPTWGFIDPSKGYGIHYAKPQKKPLRTNDMYLLKKRTDPYHRLGSTVHAKCVMDAKDDAGITGIIRLSQGATDSTTNLWGRIAGGEGLSLSVCALGDTTKNGCGDAGELFNPFRTTSGHNKYAAPEGAVGELDTILDSNRAEVDLEADIDLSGNHSIIGRSLVLSKDGERQACCTIGLTAAPKRVHHAPVYAQQPYYGAPQQSYGQGYGYQPRQW